MDKRVALPYVRDPRVLFQGTVLTRHDLPKRDERGRWTMAYKAIVAAAIKNNVISMEEAGDLYHTTSRELTRWIKLLDSGGLSALRATNLHHDAEEGEGVEPVNVIHDGAMTINCVTRLVTIGDDSSFYLTPLELTILTMLVRRSPCLVGRDEMFARLYPNGHTDPKILDVMICKIRHRFGREAIETIWGRGWRWKGAR
jgi:uncharacterized protein DUF1153